MGWWVFTKQDGFAVSSLAEAEFWAGLDYTVLCRATCQHVIV